MTNYQHISFEFPVSVLNRALELFGEQSETDANSAIDRLQSAKSRMDGTDRLRDGTAITYLGRAIDEYIAQSGPWSEEGEMSGQSGYKTWISA